MVWAKLEFDLDEEKSEYNMAVAGSGAFAVIDDLANYLRGHMKHGDYSDETYDMIEMIRERLYDLKEQYGVSDFQ